MTQFDIGKNEVALLGILGLLALAIALTPWKKLVLQYKDYQAGKYDFSGVVTESKRRRPSPAIWSVRSRYSAKSGALEVDLSHKYKASTRDLWLVAEFSSRKSRAPVTSRVMQNLPDGRYRAENLHLAKGDWLMSLTGIRREQFEFRREQVLQVD